MCEFNNDVLAAVREVERAGGATGLTGCYDAEWLCTDAITTASHAMPIKVGLVTFFPKETDPCATKRQILWAPKQIEMCTGLSPIRPRSMSLASLSQFVPNASAQCAL